MSASGDSAELEIGAGGTLLVNDGATPVACGPGGPPTVTNTETVAIVDSSDDPMTPAPFDGKTNIVIHGPAAFAPGKTLEGGTAEFSEIEFAVNPNDGSDDLMLRGDDPGADHWVMGSGGINWNGDIADPAADAELVVPPGFRELTLRTQGGNDVASARGGAGTGGPFDDSPLELSGGAGDDLLEGGDLPVGDQIEDGSGDDDVRGFAGPDLFLAREGRDLYSGGSDADELSYQYPVVGVDVDLGRNDPQDTIGAGVDTIASVENLTGTEHDDTLAGTAGPNLLIGGLGDDVVEGGGGDDSLSGETARYAGAPAGVSANLALGTATGGAGNDTLIDVVDLVGSQFPDTLTGSSLANSIEGRGGSDTVSALGGPDVVDVRDGEADAATCGSEIDSATADRASLDAVDADCETIDFLSELDVDRPPVDTDTELSFHFAGKRKQRIVKQKGVIVKAGCPLEDCTVTASGRGTLPKPKTFRKLNLGPVTESLAGGLVETIEVPLGRRGVRRLKAALAAHRRPRLTISATFADAAGNTVAEALTVKARR